VVAPPTCEPGQDTSVTSYSRLDRLAPGLPPLLTARSPGATGLASSLSGCLSSTGQRYPFSIADDLEGFHGSCLDAVSSPERVLLLCRLSTVFIWLIVLTETARVTRPCWCTVTTFYPLGNCDSSEAETTPDYLTRLEAVSHRLLSLSPFFAFTSSARTLPEELVNPASAIAPCDAALEGQSQPAWPGLSPVTWDYP
jgi:hypothetical protein